MHFGPFETVHFNWFILIDFEIVNFDPFENIHLEMDNFERGSILNWSVLKLSTLKCFIYINFGLCLDKFYLKSLKMVHF